VELSPRVLVAAAMLAFASWSDLRTRRVRNLQWYPYVAAAAAFLAADLPQGSRLLRPLALACAVALLVYLLYRAHLFGGADAKGLMVLAFLLPHPGAGDLGLPPALTVLLNASLAALAVPLAFAAWNLTRGQLRLPAMLLGVRVRLETARQSHVWPMQVVRDDGRIAWRYWQRIGADLDEAYGRLERAGASRVWVTPKVPFMVPLLVGLLLHATVGNVVAAILPRLL